MTETAIVPPIAPHELLNSSMKAPPVDPEGQKKLDIAKDIFIAALGHRLAQPETISEQSIKIAAMVAVDAASILLERLAARR